MESNYKRGNGVMIHNTDYKYFDKARQAALISDFHKVYIGCVAVYQGSIIGIGFNGTSYNGFN